MAGSNCRAFSGGDGGSREKLAGGAALEVTIELANDYRLLGKLA
ncbi:MAG TPA: hypothetical protein VN442_13995 [Bryobacteraceae bacterium]|nr:hypothetical protein [Bryobacteraceae bacterium]